MENVLTVKEAIEQGYELCGHSEKEYQTLKTISDLVDEDFNDGKLVLANKDSVSPSVSEDDIKEIIYDNVSDSWASETGDDTDDVRNIINKVDLSEMIAKVNEALSQHRVWMLTTIKLIK